MKFVFMFMVLSFFVAGISYSLYDNEPFNVKYEFYILCEKIYNVTKYIGIILACVWIIQCGFFLGKVAVE